MTNITDAHAYAFANTYSGSGDWLDESANGSDHDMAITGATYTDDGNNDYFDFNGSSDFMTTPDHADLDFNASDDFTIGIAFMPITDANTKAILDKRNGNAEGWGIRTGSGAAVDVAQTPQCVVVVFVPAAFGLDQCPCLQLIPAIDDAQAFAPQNDGIAPGNL